MIPTAKSGGAANAVLAVLGTSPGMTIEGLMAQLSLNRRQVINATRNLLRRGYLLTGQGGALTLSEAGRAAVDAGETISGSTQQSVRAIRDTFRDRAWRSMRMRRRFTVGELVSDAARGDEGQPHDNLRRYLSRLATAGIVKELPHRMASQKPGSNGVKLWFLVRNTGPMAPVWRAEARVIHDPNTGEDLPCAPL